MKPTAIILILAVAVASAMAGFYVSRSVVHGQHSVDAADTTPAFDLATLDGARVSNSNLEGRRVLINFWATWCAPCRREMPALMEAYDALDPRSATIVGIAVDEELSVRDFISEMGIDYPILLAGDLTGTRLIRDFGNPQGLMPFSVVLNEDGDIETVKLGEVTRDEVLELLSL